MPLYEYRCDECEHLEEFLQKVSDPPPAKCPACGRAKTMHKAVSLTSFQLKGGGWYKDLYSSTPKEGSSGDKGDGKSASANSKGDKKSDAKSDKKSDAKSDKAATKSDSKSTTKSDAKASSSKGGSSSKAA